MGALMDTTSWHSYPSIYNLGHRAVTDLLKYPHTIEEKVDGSQFSFGKFPVADGALTLRVRSKGAEMNIDAPEKMFTKAVETVKALAPLLHVGWTYRAEYLAKPKHNTLIYDRVPNMHLILFDVSTGDQEWLGPAEKRREADRLGLEYVPPLGGSPNGGTTTLEALRLILDNTTSVLGGQLIEGIVVKPLVELYGPDKKTLMGKFVSERFKEAHKHAWKETSPSSGDILDRLAKTYTTEARWMKAVQHLREAGKLDGSPRDIGALIIETRKDLGQEEKDAIMRDLWRWAWPHVERRVTAGLPEWYKNELLRSQFEEDHLGVTRDEDTPVNTSGHTEEVLAAEEDGTVPAL